MPPAPLYLDTARLGQMSPMAQRLSTAFNRLSAEEPFNLYCERFLKEGFESWPDRYRRRFSGLRRWGGIEHLRHGIRRLAGATDGTPVLLASRSLSLIKAAAKAAFRTCRTLLTTDLSWPGYQQAIVAEAARWGREVVTVPIREVILGSRLAAEELAEILSDVFVNSQCDSIFLPAVDNLGVRVPIANIVHRIARCASVRFVLTDAAQALAHVPLAEVCRNSDLVIAGCHKWVRGYYPLGIGIVGGRAEGNAWRTHFREAASDDDPLTGFLESLETGRFARHLETVNLGPLFSCQGALEDLRELDFAVTMDTQRQSTSQVLCIATEAGCFPVEVDESLKSGILLIACSREFPAGDSTAHAVERRLMRSRIIATVHDDGLIRLSMPSSPFTGFQRSLLRRGLCAARSSSAGCPVRRQKLR